jgi:hypothetical protein
MCKEGYRTMDELDNARVRYLRERGYKVKLVKINGTSKGNLIVASRTTKPKNSGVGGNGVEVEGAEGDEEPHKTE